MTATASTPSRSTLNLDSSPVPVHHLAMVLPPGPRRPRSGGILPLLLLLLPFLAAALLPAPARADGGFFKAQRDRIPVPIPAQRALLVHRDGIERLVVESTVDAKAQALGWILPLPAKPTSVEAATPGMLDTLDIATRPTIPPDGEWIDVLVLPALALLIAAAVHVHRASVLATPPPGTSLVRILLLPALLLVLGSIAMPNLQAGSLRIPSVTVPGVEASTARRIGNYDVTVLEAKDAAALGAWLESAGLAPLPPEAIPVVEEHVREGWVFVAARLAHEMDGIAAPHPLSVSFPAERPIYPMRLTALSGGRTDLRIHVVAGGSASCAPLRRTYSGRFEESEAERASWGGVESYASMLVEGGGRDRRRIAHEALRALLWDGCVVTRFEGAMAAEAMDRDLLPEVGPLAPWRRTLRTHKGAWIEALGLVCPILSLGLLFALLLPRGGTGDRSPLRWLLVLAAGGAVAVAGLRAGLETLPGGTTLVKGGSPTGPGMPLILLLAETDGYAGRSLDEARRVLADGIRARGILNRFSGRPLEFGDSPGSVELGMGLLGPTLRMRTPEGAVTERSWHVQRMHMVLESLLGEVGGAAEARRRLFPEGVLKGGLLNPYTGEPIHEGKGPGDAEIVEEGGRVALRAWFREGASYDFPFRWR